MNDALQWVVLIAAAVGAAGVIWAKVLRPLLRLIAVAEDLVPVLRSLVAELGGTPQAFAVLDEIIAQFRTDSGSSLRDAVDRLEESAVENKHAAQLLAVQVESLAQLASGDRHEVARLAVLLGQVLQGTKTGTATVQRIEEAANVVAADLAAAHDRADAVIDGDPGEAADAAASSDPKQQGDTMTDRSSDFLNPR